MYCNGVSTRDSAKESISIIQMAIDSISKSRSQIGAYQNRLDHSFNNINNASENLQDTESKIRDVDMAKEIVQYSKQSILEQAAQALLAQANQSSKGVISILQ